MGEVYRARDTRLDRTVAIKVLPARVASDPDLRRRFEREARAISALDHPHICALFDVGEANGTSFLVMQYLEGQTLAVRLQRGPFPLNDALTIAIQIVEAMDKAHRAGIVHRDLKPGNIMLTSAGAKLLDFGLAKLGAVGTSTRADVSLPPTQEALTVEGSILGTLQYMAPEQLQGKETDARADIFAFGALFYEMATGKKAFTGNSQASLISAIMSSDPPPIAASQPLTPPALDRVVKTCLAKDPDERWQSATDLVRELKWLAEAARPPTSEGVVGSHTNAGRHAWIAWSVATVCLIALAAFAYRQRATSDQGKLRFFVNAPDGWNLASPTSLTIGATTPLAVSPNGRQVAFVARNADGRALLWIHSLDSLAAHGLTGTDDATSPFWSPDSRFVGFFAGAKLKKIDVSGGPPVTVCDAPLEVRGGSWGRDGVIIFAPGASVATPLPTGLQKVSASGGTPSAATVFSEGEASHVGPVFLPDGRHFLYRVLKPGEIGAGAVFVASLDSSERTFLVNTTSMNVTFTQGYLLFLKETTLMAQPFDARGLRLTGEAIPVAEHIQTLGIPPLGVFSASDTVLVYRTTPASADSQLTWFDRTGKVVAVLGDRGAYGDVELSPDGTRAAISLLDSSLGTRDLWLFDVARGVRTRLTSDRAEENTPIWSPDGSRIVFDSSRRGPLELYEKASNGLGAERVVLVDGRNKFPANWSPDGRFILYMVDDGEPSGWDLRVLPLFGDQKPFPFLQTSSTEVQGQFSPDGRWVMYVSNDSGRFEVYVAPFPGPGATRQISFGGGMWPRWRHDGQEVFYLAPDGKLMASGASTHGSTFEAGTPRPLFDAHPRFIRWPYGVSADGQRFLVNTLVEQTRQASFPYSLSAVDSTPLTLVVNWTAELKK
jgi:Tol biopolymer transport system component